MIDWKLLLLLLFCDSLIHVNAQLNTCITPEGNKAICMNIWECNEQVKYIFSNKQNSIQTYQLLKAVCDYTNSVLKICCYKNTGDKTQKDNCEENSEETSEDVSQDTSSMEYQAQAHLNLLNSDNLVHNNTFIIINMDDEFLNNNKNASNVTTTITKPQETKTNKTSNSTKSEETINMSLFKQILCLILSKNSNEVISLPLNITNDENSNEVISLPQNITNDETTTLNNTYTMEVISNESEEDYPLTEEDYDISLSNENNDVDSTSTLLPNYNVDSTSTLLPNNDVDSTSTLLPNNDVDSISTLLPNPPFCGKNEEHIPIRGEYPWEVILKDAYNIYTKRFCKGTLITLQHVITTAHCVYNKMLESVLIRSHQTNSYISLEIGAVKIHENFMPYNIQNDIALIILNKPVYLEEISPICLNTDLYLDANLTGTIGYAPGYITDMYQNEVPIAKTQIIINQDDCVNNLYNIGEYLFINENIICTKTERDEEIVCLENEGSPLLIRGKSDGNMYYHQIGILSGVNYCSDFVTRPGIFLNINFYLNWILNNM